MTPATHVAVAAAVGTRFRSIAAALAISFGVHFPLDSMFHFEGFFPLSVPGGWTYQGAMVWLFVGLGVLVLPVLWWILRKNRAVGLFATYALLMCLLPFEAATRWRLPWTALLSAIAWMLTPTAEGRRWVLCGLAGYLPDSLRHWVQPLNRVHAAIHYHGSMPLGAWLSLLARGYWEIKPNDVIYDPYYQAGYALEILLEAAILFGAFYWLARRSRSVTDLPAIDHQTGAVDERSSVRE